MSDRTHNRPLHAIALLTAAATFPLIFVGGLVTSHGAGMSVPDWPNSYGYNMFLFPPNRWVGGILYEHSHRLVATAVGFCAVLLTMCAWGVARRDPVRRAMRWSGFIAAALAVLCGLVAYLPALRNAAGPRAASTASHCLATFAGLALVLLSGCFFRTREPRRPVRWLAAGVLAAVIAQGVLGGLRVVMVELDLAIVHACFAQAFFCLAALAAVVTSRWWADAPAAIPAAAGPSPARWAWVVVACVYAQLVAGASMRHYDAGLAIPDLPLAYGAVLPPTDPEGLARVNDDRVYSAGLGPVTLGQVWLHFAHRLGAVVVTAAATVLVVKVLRRRRRQGLPGLGLPTLLLAALLLTQITLGVFTVLRRKPADVASAHVAVGALVLVSAFVTAVRATRLFATHAYASPSPHSAGEAEAGTDYDGPLVPA